MRLFGLRVMLFSALTLTASRSSAQEIGSESVPLTVVEPEAPGPAAASVVSAPVTTTPSELQLSSSELAALGLGLDESEPAIDLGIKLSGFADVGFGTLLTSGDTFWTSSGALSPRPAFFVGNVNLYLTKALTTTLRSMIEVRFTYLPNGSSEYGFTEPQSTVVHDYTDYGRSTRWGSIILQRVYVEWNPYALMTVRIGQFLTPYGVWNVDHGSPTFIPVRRPWSIGMGWIPERQTGVEIYGRADVSSLSALGYHLTVSNGTGPISEYADLDRNKALGGRVFWEYRGLGWLRLGASAYFGRHTDAVFSPAIGPNGDYLSRETIRTQFDTVTWAGDLTWKLGGLHVQSELISNQRAYTTKGRATLTTLGSAVIPSDTASWGGYLLVGYRLPWLGIMPFVVAERQIGELEYRVLNVYAIQGGLNIRPTEALVVKLSVEYDTYQVGELPNNGNLLAQVAWAF